MQKHLKKIAEQEAVRYDEQALLLIAQKADGALRDALSSYDKLVTYTQGDLNLSAVSELLNLLDYDQYISLHQELKQGQVASAISRLNDILERGFDLQVFINGLGEHFRNVWVAKWPQTAQLLEFGEDIQAKYEALAKESDEKDKAKDQHNISNNENVATELEDAKTEIQKLDSTETEDAQQPWLELVEEESKVESEEEEQEGKVEVDQKKESFANASAMLGLDELTDDLSIQSALADEAVEEERPSEDLPSDDFDDSDLQKVWSIFLEDLKEKANEYTNAAINHVEVEKGEGNTVVIAAAGEVLDIIQIPAYLCMQTTLVVEAAKTDYIAGTYHMRIGSWAFGAQIGLTKGFWAQVNFEAAHVNYGLRGEDSNLDAAFCAELCAIHQVPFHVMEADYASREKQ
ncbi:unnamed protein product, partial [Cyprideis torosa]